MTQALDATGTYGFIYDNMNRLTEADTTYTFLSGQRAVKYGYDAGSNRNSMTDPQSVPTTYGYDTLNRLSSLTYSGQIPNYTFGYDPLSRRTSLTRPNGIATSYGYDPVSNLLSVLHKLGTTTLDGATYTYDGAGNRKTRTDKRTNVTLTYTSDTIYQLKTAKQGSTTKESYTYDLVGNRLSSLGVSPYNYNTSNELTSTPRGNYTYDSNGSRNSDPTGATYTWDFDNRLTQVVLPGSGGTVSFKYDPFGRRIQKSFVQGSTTTTTNYLYDGTNLLEEIDQSGNVLARHTQTSEFDEQLSEVRSGVTSYYNPDGLGSITSLSNSAGGLASTYSYDSFGKLTGFTGTISNSFQYAGREIDSETGLYYDRARYYDTTIGRFVSEDPIGFDGGLNFYEYAYNEPTTLDDPTGDDPGVVALPWITVLPEIPVAGQVAVAGATGWYIGRGIGHIPIGNGDTVDDAVTNGFASILIYFAKGGKQNISNEYVDEAKNMFGNNKDKICKWLDDLYAASGPAARQKIVKAQKYFGCRRCGGGGN